MNKTTMDIIVDANKELYCNPCTDHPIHISTKRLSPFDVIESVCDYLKIDVAKVLSKCRERNLVEARFMISDLLYHDTFLNLSLKNIGLLLGGRDHTTIINSLRTLRNLIETSDDYKEKLANIYIHVYSTTKYFTY